MTPALEAQRNSAPIIGAIWAQARNGIIGAKGAMPWHVPEDLAHFKRITAGHPVIMGRNTWESFPAKFRPLPGRSNIVLSSRTDTYDELRLAGALPAATFKQALEIAQNSEGSEEIWVIGGGQIYAQALSFLDTAVITKLNLSPEGDTKAPELTSDFVLKTTDPATEYHLSKSGIEYRFEFWTREKE